MSKEKKIKVPKSVLDLRMSPKKFAKKNNIRIKGKGMSKSERKHNKKRLKEAYAENAINGLNKAVKILADHPEGNFLSGTDQKRTGGSAPVTRESLGPKRRWMIPFRRRRTASTPGRGIRFRRRAGAISARMPR